VGQAQSRQSRELAVLNAAVDAWVLVWGPRREPDAFRAWLHPATGNHLPPATEHAGANARLPGARWFLAGATLQTKRRFVPAPVRGQFGRQLPAALAEQTGGGVRVPAA